MKARKILEMVGDDALLHFIRWGWFPKKGSDGGYSYSDSDGDTLKALWSGGGGEDTARTVAKERNLL